MGSKFLLAKMAEKTFERMYSCGPHIDTQGTNDATPSNTLIVFSPDMSPIGVPMVEALLEGRQV